jgi:molybdopterin converting factor small subunit
MKKYRFPLDRSLVHLAVNDAYASWDMPLSPGDRVVFVPPVSGG